MMYFQAQSESGEEAASRLPELEPSLSSDDLARILRHLCEQRADLHAGIARLEAQLAEASASQHPSPLRRARSKGDTPLAVLRGELDKTTRALARLREGRYGLCQECGQPITRQRLAIVPSAERCDACAQGPRPAPSTH